MSWPNRSRRPRRPASRSASCSSGSDQDVFEEFTDGDLAIADDELFLDLDDEQLLIDPTDEDILQQLGVFGVGENLGLLPDGDDR